MRALSFLTELERWAAIDVPLAAATRVATSFLRAQRRRVCAVHQLAARAPR
jgi:hypothetical protein